MVSMATDLLRKSRRNVSQSLKTLKFNNFKGDTHKKKEQMGACISLARLPLAKRRDCSLSLEWISFFLMIYGGMVALKFHSLHVLWVSIDYEKAKRTFS